MFIVDCLPFSKGLNKDVLSYFSIEHIEPGSLLKVKIRNKKITALVTNVRDARESKSEIRSADFKLNKITSFLAKPFLQKEFLESVKETSKYFATTEGSVLSHLIPLLAVENPEYIYSKNKPVAKTDLVDETKRKDEILAIQSEDEDRISNYKSLIREEFAKNKSVFICLPQNENIVQMKKELDRGIESYVCTFHKYLKKTEFKKELEKAKNNSHPVVIIGTPRWLFLRRDDLGTIILEKENENGWKTISRPFLDLRYFAESLAKNKKIKIIFGDSFLRMDTLYRYKEGEIMSFENVKWRLPTDIETITVDLKESQKKEKTFRAVSSEMIEDIRTNVDSGLNSFIFAARKGISSVVICQDCGTEVKCNNCHSPMVFYKSKATGYFRCHQCGENREATEYCQNCRSWNLEAFGSGMDRVSEEIAKEIPYANIYEIDRDKVTTGARATNLVKNFYDNKGSVLIGNEMALPYLYKKISSTYIASFDSLFAIPDFRIREKIFRIILQTKNLAKKKFLIQSRNFEDKTIESAITGNVTEFYTKEIDDRRVLGYPPFGIFIKVTLRGTRYFVDKEIKKFKETLEEYGAVIFNSVHEKKGEQFAVNAVIKIPRDEWPDPEVLSMLKSLPPYAEVKVDPENLL